MLLLVMSINYVWIYFSVYQMGLIHLTHFFHVRRQHLVATVHFGFRKSYYTKKLKFTMRTWKFIQSGETFYAYRQLQLALFYGLQNKSKSNTNAHFQHLPVQAPYSYKTVPCCSLTSGLTLLSTNNFTTYYIALSFYLKILVATSCWTVCQTKVRHTYLLGRVAAGSGKW